MLVLVQASTISGSLLVEQPGSLAASCSTPAGSNSRRVFSGAQIESAICSFMCLQLILLLVNLEIHIHVLEFFDGVEFGLKCGIGIGDSVCASTTMAETCVASTSVRYAG